MFNNRFNSTKKDPLVEAVQSAMQDGEIRRQAEALVNEAFGVYNRNAVVREDLAEYDAAIEEAYKCMKEGEKKDEPKLDMKAREKAKSDYSKMREKMVGKGKDLETTRKIVGEAKKIKVKLNPEKEVGYTVHDVGPGGKKTLVKSGKDKVKDIKEAKKLADKDYDKDGKIESPKDEVWGSRFRAAKMAGKMEEEQIDELKAPTAKTAHDAYRRAERSDDEKGNWDRSNRLYKNLKKKYPGKSDRNQKPTGKAKLPQVSNTEFHKDGYSGHVTKKGKLTKSATKDTKADIKSRLGRHTKPNLPEEVDYSAPDRAAVTRDNKPSTPAQTNAATSGPSAADKAALTSKIKTMKEAVYSAKAARAGKDIGKPGKEFKKIAAKAGKKYGSEERGKKVAGAILARIRAKHMKEEQIDEIVVQKSQMRPGETLGQTMNRLTGKTAIKGGANDPTSSKFKGSTSSAPKAAPVDAPSPKSQTGSSRMDALKSITNPTPTVSKTQNMGSSISTGGSSAMDAVSALSAKQAATPGERSAPVNKMQNMGSSISTGGSSAMDKISSMGAAQASDTQKAKDVARGVTSFAQPSSITGGIGAASSPKDSRNKFSVDESKALKESVQVGANRYRIV